jgi:hypothetical protein
MPLCNSLTLAETFLNNFDKRIMNMRIYLSIILLFALASARSQGYKITAQYTYQPDSYLYLGHYFGDKKFLQDSAIIQMDGSAVIKGDKSLVPGLYILVDPKKERFFDLVIDKEQVFSVTVDTAFVMKSIKGSEENNQLEAYKQATATIFKDYPEWQKELSAAKNKKDSTAAQDKISGAVKKAEQWRDSFIQKQPDSYASLLFRLMREPEFKVGGNKTREDSAAAFQEYKSNYWKDIPIESQRVLRTPMFEARVTKFMEQVVTRHPDSLKKEIDKFILYSRADTIMFKYYINRFTNEYMNPKFMGLDVIFLHLFEKYYQTNQVTWLSEKDKELVYNRAYNLMGNIVGEPAADPLLLDTLAKPQNLYSIKAPYTLVVFWDPDCGHCREQVPKIDSMYNADWKNTGIKLVGVLVDTLRTSNTKWPAVREKWTKYIVEHKLNNWHHWYQSYEMREEERKKNIPNFRQNYDVYQTPTIYLLDEEKRIIAKKISPEQIHDFLEFQKNQSSSKKP